MVVWILTDVAGRQSYMVQGVRSSKGKGNRAALLQPMFLIEFEGIVPTHGELHRMKDTRALKPLGSIPFDPRKSTIALFMAEVLYRLVRETEPDSPLFGFVCRSVEALDVMDEGVANFHLWFLVKLSYYLGFYPGNEYRDGAWFDISEGLFTPLRPDHKISLSSETSRMLNDLACCPPEELHRLPYSRNMRSDFMNGILTYFGYHLNTLQNVESLRILREVF